MRKSTSLDTVKTGSKVRVLALRGGREFQHRIQSLGVSVGCEVYVMQNNSSDNDEGAIAVRIGDTRLMIGHGMAQKVVVR